MKIGVSGHRELKGSYSLDDPIWQWVKEQFESILDEAQPTLVVSGMAIGFDMLAAESAINAGVSLRAAIPFVGQEQKWPQDQQNNYHDLINKAHSSFLISDGGYSNWKFHARNQFIVDNTNMLVACWSGVEKGGTFSTINYACKKQRPIRVIDPENKEVYWYYVKH